MGFDYHGGRSTGNKHNVRYKIVCDMVQTLEEHISRSKAPFSTILVPLTRGDHGCFNDIKLVKNGALGLEIGSSQVCAVSQIILSRTLSRGSFPRALVSDNRGLLHAMGA